MSFFRDTDLEQRIRDQEISYNKKLKDMSNDIESLRKDFDKEIDYLERRLETIDNGVIKRLNDLYGEIQSLKNSSYRISNSLALIESKIYFEKLSNEVVPPFKVLLPKLGDSNEYAKESTVSSIRDDQTRE